MSQRCANGRILAGAADFLLKIVVVDWDCYRQLVARTLTAAPNGAYVTSALAIGASKRVSEPYIGIGTEESDDGY